MRTIITMAVILVVLIIANITVLISTYVRNSIVVPDGEITIVSRTDSSLTVKVKSSQKMYYIVSNSTGLEVIEYGSNLATDKSSSKLVSHREDDSR